VHCRKARRHALRMEERAPYERPCSNQRPPIDTCT
jgi:hypothetical protein